MTKLRIALAVLLVAIGIVGLSAVYTVNERERALVLEFGKFVHEEGRPGIHFKLPFFQQVRYFDKRVLDLDIPPDEIPTADQEQIIVDAIVRYRIVNVRQFYLRTRGSSTDIFEQQRLTAIVNGAVRAEFGRVNLETLLGFAIGTASGSDPDNKPKKPIKREDREKLRNELTERITKRVRGTIEREFGVKIIDVRIKRLDLPEGNKQAILKRMAEARRQEATRIRAEGEAKARKIRADADRNARVTIAEAKKQAEILRGRGEADAQKIYNAAFGKDPEFFRFWTSMNAYRAALAGKNTRLLMPPNSEFFRYFGNMNGKRTLPAKTSK